MRLIDTIRSRLLFPVGRAELEILGSTESCEIEYHLGSFCIAMSGHILGVPRFRRNSRDLALFDVRPPVIRRGEMGLFKVLRQCVSSPGQLGALYGAWRSAEEVNRDDARHVRARLPVVALDRLDRGMFNLTDPSKSAMQSTPKEGWKLRRKRMKHPFGGDTLIGWKNATFMRGYL